MDSYHYLLQQNHGHLFGIKGVATSIPLLISPRRKAMPTNVSDLGTAEIGNVQLWFFTISHQVGPLTPETFSNEFTTQPPHCLLLFARLTLGRGCNCPQSVSLVLWYASKLPLPPCFQSQPIVAVPLRCGQENCSQRPFWQSSRGFIPCIWPIRLVALFPLRMHPLVPWFS